MKNHSCNTVLLVEDNPAEAELARVAFQTLNIHCTLIHCANSEQLMNLLEKIPPEEICYILLDLNMPRQNGVEVLKFLSQKQDWKLIPTIVFTTSNHDRDVISCYESGANAYVLKPLNLAEFDHVIGTIHHFWGKFNFRPAPARL